MAAKDLDTAEKTPLLAAFPKMLFPALTVVPGVAALVVMPDQLAGNYNLALPLMVLKYYPAGLLGLGMTALLASFMSGMAGNVTAFNTVWTYDVYQNYLAPGRTDRHYLNVGRMVTVIGILISIGTAYTARSFPNVFDYWALLSAIFVGAPFGTFVLGAFTEGVGGTAAFCGMLAGVITTTANYVTYERGWIHYGSDLAMDFCGAAFGFFANASMAVLLASLARRRVRVQACWVRSSQSEKKSWMRKPAALATAAALLMIILNVIFW